ncbi:sine oculis-binding protein homolog B-like [Hylaeus volcanicus]|uniref:sine oculis-binding protein homolog B-like n=1 Tax=Hylaeus volcanicus TaxID=313075 RepID=UPI0023B8569B|nr:sine oculis-binding protein homolog B-like [Hylaeus volcanicus]
MLSQEYAATTMSELLGWYGYDKVDSGCTRSLNLDHFTSTSDVRSSKILKMDQNFISNKQASKSPISLNENNSSFDTSNSPLPYSVNSTSIINRQSTSPPLPMSKISPDSTSRFPYENYPNSICSDSIFCSWCGRVTKTCKSDRGNHLSYKMIHTMGHFCSEACFAAGRRADWCRHIRNPVSYVDFQVYGYACLFIPLMVIIV